MLKLQSNSRKSLNLTAALLILFTGSFWYLSERLWFPVDINTANFNGDNIGGDYEVFKSFWGDYLLLHQDNGNQYLICPHYQQISILNIDRIYLVFVFTYQPLASVNPSKEKVLLPSTDFPDPQLKITSDKIQFYGVEWKDNANQARLWTIRR